VTTNAELLAKYSPYVQYDSFESFAADSPATMTDCVPDGFPRGNTLCQDSKKPLAAANPAAGGTKLDLNLLRGGKYRDSAKTKVSPKDYIDAVGKDYVEASREMHTRPGYADQVYGYAATDTKGSLWLQYWFFYYYNDKAFLGFGLHEGDWEMIQLRIGASGRPNAATYAQHSHGERAAWKDVERKGGAPVLYSARGSHAAYFRPGVYTQAPLVPDQNDAGGPLVRPRLNLIEDKKPAWVAWPGRWGSSRALISPIGSDSPDGPRFHGSWQDPLEFHEEAKPARELEPVVGARLAMPPTPKVEVRREESRAVVSYRFPKPDPAAPKLRGLLLSVDGHKDGRPPATQVFDLDAAPDEVEFPLDLEDRAYTVRAAPVGENGVTGPAAAAELPPSD
jgi:hypothetical protein